MREAYHPLTSPTHSGPLSAREIIDALEQPHRSAPSVLLNLAADRWHHVREALLARANQEIEEVRLGRIPEYSDITIFTLYLAAEKKEAEAFPTLLRLLSVEDIRTIERFGEVFTDDMPVVLADCFPGEQGLGDLEALVANGSLAVACRRAVLNCLEILAWERRVTPARLRGFLERLADGALEPDQPRLWAAFAEVCLAAGLVELEAVVLEAAAREWIDPRAIPAEVLTAAFAQVRQGTYRPFPGPMTIQSAAAEVEAWDWDAASHKPAPRPRTGRNDPCPCGSGKKFKRCCAGS